MELLSCPIGILIIFGVGYLAAKSEARKWNNGICQQNGKPWVKFDDDSQGGRGYRSDDYFCWISYPSVDRDYLTP